MPQEISQKIRNNGIVAYLMLFISWLMLFNKENPNVNNSFVKSHIKSSIIIHILILLCYIVFSHYNFLSWIVFLWVSLWTILATIAYLILWFMLARWVIAAYKWNTLSMWEAVKFWDKLSLDINNDNIVDEKDKLTIILTHIPFVGYMIWSQYDNERVKNIIKINLLSSLIIVLVYLLWYWNITLLLMLIYIVFVSFNWAYLFLKDEVITINLPNIILPRYSILYLKAFFTYIKLYFKWNFKNYSEILNEKKLEQEKDEEAKTLMIEKLPPVKLSKYLIYIPFINIIFLFQKANQHTYHIRNWLTITFLYLIFLIALFFSVISSKLLILFLFPICFGIWMLNKLYYKMPYIYDLYSIFDRATNVFNSWKKKIDEKRKEVKEVNLKVKK